MAFGADRLYALTRTVFRPDLPILTGRHLIRAIPITSFSELVAPACRRASVSEEKCVGQQASLSLCQWRRSRAMLSL